MKINTFQGGFTLILESEQEKELANASEIDVFSRVVSSVQKTVSGDNVWIERVSKEGFAIQTAMVTHLNDDPIEDEQKVDTIKNALRDACK